MIYRTIMIAERVKKLTTELGDVRLCVVTKQRSLEEIRQAIDGGARILGENRVQEAMGKYEIFTSEGEVPQSRRGESKDFSSRQSFQNPECVIPPSSLKLPRTGQPRRGESTFRDALKASGIELHLIGHLQTNKVRDAVGVFDCIQSVDSLRLSKKISETCVTLGRTLDIFLEVNLTGEMKKSGFAVGDLERKIEVIRSLPSLRIRGLMCMGKLGDFAATREVFRRCRLMATELRLAEVSMGMSEDYHIAIEEGATMVRVGRGVFE